MKIEELRLNNYVKSNCHKGLITSIMGINQTSVGLWCNPLAIYKIDEVSPVEVTPEILEKAGFEFGVNDNATYYIDLNGIDQQLDIILSRNEFYPRIVQAGNIIEQN